MPIARPKVEVKRSRLVARPPGRPLWVAGSHFDAEGVTPMRAFGHCSLESDYTYEGTAEIHTLR